MVSVCLPSDALLQHLLSYLGFSYLGLRVSPHSCSSKAQLLLLTLDEGYLLTAAPPDLECGIAPLGRPAPTRPPPPNSSALPKEADGHKGLLLVPKFWFLVESNRRKEVHSGSLRGRYNCLLKKDAQLESCELSFIWGKMRTAAREATSQITLRDCSEGMNKESQRAFQEEETRSDFISTSQLALRVYYYLHVVYKETNSKRLRDLPQATHL